MEVLRTSDLLFELNMGVFRVKVQPLTRDFAFQIFHTLSSVNPRKRFRTLTL